MTRAWLEAQLANLVEPDEDSRTAVRDRVAEILRPLDATKAPTSRSGCRVGNATRVRWWSDRRLWCSPPTTVSPARV